MKQVRGTYQNGTVVLDMPVDWPPGTSVAVIREATSPGVLEDVCVGGSVWEDKPEAIQEWIGWFDSLEPVFRGEELEQFEAELRSAREEQHALVAPWQDRIAQLLK